MSSNFLYKELKNIISESDNYILTKGLDRLWERDKEKIESKEFFLKKGYTLETAEKYIKEVGIELAHMCYNTTYIVKSEDLDEESANTLFRLRKKLNEYWLKDNYGVTKPGRWHTMLNISMTHPYAGLQPHTDNPEELVERNPNHIPAYIKGLVYIGDRDKDYTDLGTRLYKGKGRETEFKEIPFIPTNGLLFIPNEFSYHGTFYNSTEIKKRYTVVFEYVLLEDIEK